MKKIIIFISCVIIFYSCHEELPGFISGKPGIQFIMNMYEDTLTKSSQFYYSSNDKLRDTIWFDVCTQGAIPDKDYRVKFEAYNQTKWNYQYDNKGNVIDSTLYEFPNQAVAGVHYVDFDDPSVASIMIIKSGALSARIPVITLRDASLKTATHILNFRVVSSDETRPGDIKHCTGRVKISDGLSRPLKWTDWFFAGKYGKVKHAFMIDVSGKRWDDDFIASQDDEINKYYLYIFNRELKKLNADRLSRGLNELRENDADPLSAVTFPNN